MNFDWWQWVLLGVGADLVGSIPAYALASYKEGGVTKTQLDPRDGMWARTTEEKQEYDFWYNLRCTPVLWPLFLSYLVVIDGLVGATYDALQNMSEGLQEQGKKNSDRRLASARTKRYDELWNERNDLPYGQQLHYREQQELTALERVIDRREDTRKAPADHYVYLHQNSGGDEVMICSCKEFKAGYYSDNMSRCAIHLVSAKNKGESVQVIDRIRRTFSNAQKRDIDSAQPPKPSDEQEIYSIK